MVMAMGPTLPKIVQTAKERVVEKEKQKMGTLESIKVFFFYPWTISLSIWRPSLTQEGQAAAAASGCACKRSVGGFLHPAETKADAHEHGGQHGALGASACWTMGPGLALATVHAWCCANAAAAAADATNSINALPG